MAKGARLTSIDAVDAMMAAVERFRNEAAAALDDLDMEIRRALEWIHHDRKEHWGHEVRRGYERVTETRLQLQQAMTFRRIADHEPACIDEKKAVDRAKRRLEMAQRKVEEVRHWTRNIDHAVNEYRGSRTQMSGWLDGEYPKAIAALKRMMEALETYVRIAVPEEVARPKEWSAVETMGAASVCTGAGGQAATAEEGAGETPAPQDASSAGSRQESRQDACSTGTGKLPALPEGTA